MKVLRRGRRVSPRGSRRRAPLARDNRRVDRERLAQRRRQAGRALRLALVASACGFIGYHAVRMADARGWLSPFRVREVRVVGAEVASPAVLVAEAGLIGEELHYWSVLDPYVHRVRRDPLIESARFQRRFPNGLTLEVKERRPIVLLALERLTPVDGAGIVLPVNPFHAEWDAPVLEVAERSSQAQVIQGGRIRDEVVLGAVTWLDEVGRRYPELAREISSIRIDAEGMLTLHLVHAAGEVLLARDTPVDKMGWVDEVIRDLQEKGVEFTRLDLRFPDQIVVRRASTNL
ncbi:MAG TPA: FtsQ-type POTRA domain-containing protein [Gemmatimonadota bacterium]|nr:FtsQ-type POTRA domain-containing protein [Gemmatimonadota bacterium]